MLLQITEKKANGIVSGTHLQWCCDCSLADAIKRARDTEKVNSSRIEIAVVDDLYNAYCLGKYYENLKRLDS